MNYNRINPASVKVENNRANIWILLNLERGCLKGLREIQLLTMKRKLFENKIGITIGISLLISKLRALNQFSKGQLIGCLPKSHIYKTRYTNIQGY
jgi:hypothetical protein